MPEVFADTGYWIGLLNPRDQLHNIALNLRRSLSDQRIVTTEMVLTELLNHASNRGAEMRLGAANMVNGLIREAGITIIPQTTRLFRVALERYRARPDQAWSIVDCASFILMEERGIREALAFDRHFEQAGFTVLLRDSD